MALRSWADGRVRSSDSRGGVRDAGVGALNRRAAQNTTGDSHMAEYVDGFVIPVPKKKIGEYRRIARIASKVWRDHGALDYRECVADDVTKGKTTSFPRSVKLKPNE